MRLNSPKRVKIRYSTVFLYVQRKAIRLTHKGISRYQRKMTPGQCRAARGLLNWTQQDLAGHAQVGVATVRQFEGGRVEPHRATISAVERAFEKAGIIFIAENGGGVGLRLKKRKR